MQISEAAGGSPVLGVEPCRFPKLEECAHFHYERVQLPQLNVSLQTNMDQSLHSQHTAEDDDTEWHMVQVTSGGECWLLQRSFENFRMLDAQLHQCIYDRKISQLKDLSSQRADGIHVENALIEYLAHFSTIADNSVNCGPVLNWFQMDNKGHRLLVPSEESRSINTPAVAAAYSVRRYVSQARDELNLEVGDMISVIDMASPTESMWWRGKRGFQVGFFPQHCVHIIGDKVPRNMPLPPPVVGSLALTPIKPVLRKHGKLIAFFRSFILNRPSRRRLKQSGILKERVFGCDLGEHLLNSGHEIPMVLKCCAEFIEKHGIVDGIYRLSGVTSNIQRLRNAFDEDRIPDLYTEDILQDIHSVASLLKMYFRELPNPLCTYQLYQSFVNAVQGCNNINRNSSNDRERLLNMREAVQKLPPPHYRTLEYLMRHLSRVAQHGTSTGMTTRNVAIVWAPNLLRCADLEMGGVAALQGVGVQAVVTEFLICYADLIFCDHLPSLNQNDSTFSPKRSRPKSLAISTPTKLITLEEARNKHLHKSDECGYIEVGGGPSNLPKKYHTVLELPSGSRKRGFPKRSPLGWRSFFSKSRNSSQGSLVKNRKSSTPSISTEKSATESELNEIKRKLRPVKSAESLTEPVEIDGLGPLQTLLNKPAGHNRSVSHDSYFDTLQSSQNNSEGSLLDLSEIQLNFELEESEMRIFSEDDSLVSSPRIHRDSAHRKILARARPEEFSAANSTNPSPKKQARVVNSPDALSRKRTRLEDQLSDIQYIDCNTPDNTVSTVAVVHPLPVKETYQPRNKSPRSDKRQSLNLESAERPTITKSFTETNIGDKLAVLSTQSSTSPQSPMYKQLGDTSSTTTPDLSPQTEISYQNLKQGFDNAKKSPTYENVLTTISIVYRSPSKASDKSIEAESVYEDVNPEQALVPTVPASLPLQQASQPQICDKDFVPFNFLENGERSTPTDLSLSEVLHSSTENLSSQSSISFPVSPSSPIVSPIDPETPEADTNALAIPTEPESDSDGRSSANDKRKSESADEVVYQQVKYFRRSVHEVNALLNESEPETYDSLEAAAPVYENVDGLPVYENVSGKDSLEGEECRKCSPEKKLPEKVNVRNLTSKFETGNFGRKAKKAEPEAPKKLEEARGKFGSSVSLEEDVRKVVYGRDTLPPCLRAKNLKTAKKTRSLDEDAFNKELLNPQRRKSLDENFGSKMNTLKKLNQPKTLPFKSEELDIHLAHSNENVSLSLPEQKLSRERIEKYKEERRKFLHDKYKSESFREDKDLLLLRLKQKKGEGDKKTNDEPKTNTLSELNERSTCKKELKTAVETKRSDSDGIKSKTALFEAHLNQSKKEPIPEKKKECKNDASGDDFIRHKKRDDEVNKSERRRHTFEARERETEAERVRRISLESRSPRKENRSPSYCIKDMKAIFESKSQQ